MVSLDVVGRDDTLLDELLGVDLRDRLVGLDLGGHLGLGVSRLVGLVVAVAAVADDVDHDIPGKALAVAHRQAHRGHARLDVVGVDVDDRAVVALGQVAGVRRGAVLGRVGGEAHLVVRDDVDGAAGRVALERLQVERLGDDALAREGGVAMEQQRHGHMGAVVEARPGVLCLRGARSARDDRVDELEVGRVGVHPDPDLLAVGGREDALRAMVVLDVARSRMGDGGNRLYPVESLRALELGHDRLSRAARGCGRGRSAGRGGPCRSRPLRRRTSATG